MKYIVFENGGAVLFGNGLSHKDVAGIPSMTSFSRHVVASDTVNP